MLCVSTVDATPLHDFSIFLLKKQKEERKGNFYWGRGKTIKNPEEKKRKGKEERKSNFYWGRGKTIKNPEEKKRKDND